MCPYAQRPYIYDLYITHRTSVLVKQPHVDIAIVLGSTYYGLQEHDGPWSIYYIRVYKYIDNTKSVRLFST